MESDYIAFVHVLCEFLAESDIRYGIGGSLASSLYGRPRNTYDVDVTVQMQVSHLTRLAAWCTTRRWTISETSAQKAVITGGDFQIIDGMTGFKADFYVLAPQPSSQHQRDLERIRLVGFGNQMIWLLSPEDTILHKLEWYQMGKSEKHIRDIGGMVALLGDQLDLNYLRQWISILGASEIWQRIEEEYRKRNGESSG